MSIAEPTMVGDMMCPNDRHAGAVALPTSQNVSFDVVDGDSILLRRSSGQSLALCRRLAEDDLRGTR
jgi:hypothetical protein